MGGIYGTLYDFKKDGVITREGRLASFGIVGSAGLAIGIQVNDAIDAAKAAEKLKGENRRLETILQNSESTVNRLTEATADLTRIRGTVDQSSDNLKKGLE